MERWPALGLVRLVDRPPNRAPPWEAASERLEAAARSYWRSGRVICVRLLIGDVMYLSIT